MMDVTSMIRLHYRVKVRRDFNGLMTPSLQGRFVNHLSMVDSGNDGRLSVTRERV